MPKRRFSGAPRDKSWKLIIDGWMRERRIRRACMLFAGFALLIVAVVVVAFAIASAGALGGIGAAAGKAVGIPGGWVAAGGGVTVGGGVAAVRWLRRRRGRPSRVGGE
uniref:hypothetical protein n=1 Tax=Amycolatopsis sp. CA-082387 TaxID=3239918 RepID=UPI003F493F27